MTGDTVTISAPRFVFSAATAAIRAEIDHTLKLAARALNSVDTSDGYEEVPPAVAAEEYRAKWFALTRALRQMTGASIEESEIESIWSVAIKAARDNVARDDADLLEISQVVRTFEWHTAALDRRSIDAARGGDLDIWQDNQEVSLVRAMRLLRKRLNWSEMSLANAIGVEASEITAVEADDLAPSRNLLKLLLALARDAEHLTMHSSHWHESPYESLYERYCPMAPATYAGFLPRAG